MAHIQRKCGRCRRSMPQGSRACPACGTREARWIARYRGPDRVERSRTFGRRLDAERFLHGQESAKLRGEWIDPDLARIVLREWVDRWRGTMVHLKPKTRAGYESLLRTLILPALGDVPLGGHRHAPNPGVGGGARGPRSIGLPRSPGVPASRSDHTGGGRVRLHRPNALRGCPAPAPAAAGDAVSLGRAGPRPL